MKESTMSNTVTTMQEKLAKRQADIRSRQNVNTSRSANQAQQQPRLDMAQPGKTNPGNKRGKVRAVRRTTEDVEVPQEDSVKVEVLDADNAANLDTANTELPLEPCLFYNTPRGIATNYFKQVICDQDQRIYATASCNQQMNTFYLLHMQSANVFEAFSNRYKDLETRYNEAKARAQREAENATFLKQTTDEILSRISLKEKELQQLRLTNTNLSKKCYTWESRCNNLQAQQSSISTIVVNDLKHSEAGRDWVEKRALDWFLVGFTRCQVQFQESGLFPPDAKQDFVNMGRPMPNEFSMSEFNPDN